MAKKPNKECFTCSEKYYYCPSCSSEVKESYYNMFHCERCAKIFQSLTNEFLGKITTQECKKELIDLRVSANEVFKDNIRNHINKVMGNDAKVEEVKEKEIEAKKIKVEENKESELVSSIKDENSKEVSKVTESSEIKDVNKVETKEIVNRNINKKFRNYKNSEVD